MQSLPFKKNPLLATICLALAAPGLVMAASSDNSATSGPAPAMAAPSGNSAASGDAVPALNEIVVSGSREKEPISKTPATISVISQKQMKEAHYQNVGDALNTVPGVYAPELSGNEQHDMAIRQPLSPNFLYQYLEDGIPIRPTGIYNYNALVEMNPDEVQRIEVIKGPSSSLFGSNAVGGAINFITAPPAAQPEGFIGVQDSNQGYHREDFGISTTSGSTGVNFTGYQAQRRNGWQENSDFNKQSYTLRVDHAIDSQTTLDTTLTSNHYHTQVPGFLTPLQYFSGNRNFSFNTFTVRDFNADRLASTLRHEWSPKSLSTVSVYLRDDSSVDLTQGKFSTDPNSSQPINTTGGKLINGNRINDHFTSRGIDARQRQDFDWANARLIVGANAEHSPYGATVTYEDALQNPVTGIYSLAANTAEFAHKTGQLSRNYTVGLTNESGYGQFEFSPLRATRFVLGGRYDRINYDYTNNLIPGATTGAPSQTQDYTHFSPKAGVTYSLSPTANLYADYSQGFIPPDVSQLYGHQNAPDLKSSVYNSYEAGARFAFAHGRGLLNAAIYRMDGKNEIIVYNQTQTIGNGTQTSQTPQNAGKTRHQGIELGASYAATPQIDLRFAGAYADHRYLDYLYGSSNGQAINFSGHEMRDASHLIANAEIGYKPTHLPGARLAFEVEHLGAYWMNDANTVRYPGHTIMNLRTNYRRGAWEFWGSLLNLNNKLYSEVATSTYTGVGAYNPATNDTYVPGEPRSLYVGAAYHFGGHGRDLASSSM